MHLSAQSREKGASALGKAFRLAALGLGLSLGVTFNTHAQMPTQTSPATVNLQLPPLPLPLWQQPGFPFATQSHVTPILTTASFERHEHVLFFSLFRPFAYLRMEAEAGYGHLFPLGHAGRHGSFSYEPGIAFGLREDREWNPVVMSSAGAYGAPYRITGVGGNFTNRIAWKSPGGRLNVFAENSLSMYSGGAEYLPHEPHAVEMWNFVGVSYKLSKPAQPRLRL